MDKGGVCIIHCCFPYVLKYDPPHNLWQLGGGSFCSG